MKVFLEGTSKSHRYRSPPLEPTATVEGCVGCHSRQVILRSNGLVAPWKWYDDRERTNGSCRHCRGRVEWS